MKDAERNNERRFFILRSLPRCRVDAILVLFFSFSCPFLLLLLLFVLAFLLFGVNRALAPPPFLIQLTEENPVKPKEIRSNIGQSSFMSRASARSVIEPAKVPLDFVKPSKNQ